LVVKQAAATAGAGAGGFAGGFFSSPGAVAGLGIVTAIIVGLVLFRNDIRNFFGTTLPESIASIGDIQLPSINLPDITFPEFNFPEINLPDITFPDFNFSLPSFGEIPGVPEPFVEPERQDVPFGDTGQIIDVVPDVTGGRADRFAGLTPAEIFGIEERGAMDPRLAMEPSDAELFARDFPEIFVSVPDFSIVGEREDIPFAVANVEETQAEFQERAGAFVEALPEVTAFTSLPGAETDFVRRQLSRESEDFESVLEAEARRSQTIFAGLFGNVQNPDFGA